MIYDGSLAEICWMQLKYNEIKASLSKLSKGTLLEVVDKMTQ